MIYYEAHGIDKRGLFSPKVGNNTNRLVEVKEGQFHKGLLDGFGRSF